MNFLGWVKFENFGPLEINRSGKSKRGDRIGEYRSDIVVHTFGQGVAVPNHQINGFFAR